jgi:small-conductance mechanosensitive channel/CRP-like cAMP-binding protein
MSFWHQVEIAGEMGSSYPWVLAGQIVLALVLASVRRDARFRMRVSVLLLLLSLLGTVICAGILYHGPTEAASFGFLFVHFLAQLLYVIGTIQVGGTLLFRFLLPQIGLALAPILLDMLFGLAYITAILLLLGHHGVNLSGIVATSAVLTAIIGFSLQDTLGNIMGGVSLQAERSIAVGDWVRIGEVEGIIRETRWRQTSIETRDWDTVVIPNSVLMKSMVTVLGRRTGRSRLHRVLVHFNADFRYSPTEVVDAIDRAVQDVAITDVATDPKPVCILNEFRENYGSYLVAYWTADMSKIPLTSGEVRRRIVMALQRAGLSVSVTSQNVVLNVNSTGRETRRRQEELARQMAAIEAVDLLAPLNEQERRELCASLTTAPFRRGEIISRQGEEADYLYILTKGEATVRVANASGASSRVGTLRAGDVFGETGMMTGQPRTATVEAQTDVVCYRLDKEGFKATLQRRPEIADAISRLLAEYKLNREGILSGLNADGLQTEISQAQGDMLRRIRNFFLLTS